MPCVDAWALSSSDWLTECSGVTLSCLSLTECSGVTLSCLSLTECSGVTLSCLSLTECSGVTLSCFTISRWTIFPDVWLTKEEDSFTRLFNAILYSVS